MLIILLKLESLTFVVAKKDKKKAFKGGDTSSMSEEGFAPNTEKVQLKQLKKAIADLYLSIK